MITYLVAGGGPSTQGLKPASAGVLYRHTGSTKWLVEPGCSERRDEARRGGAWAAAGATAARRGPTAGAGRGRVRADRRARIRGAPAARGRGRGRHRSFHHSPLL